MDLGPLTRQFQVFADIFSLGDRKLLGLDIGLSSIKVAQLEYMPTRCKLIRFATVPLPELSLVEDEIQKVPEVVEAIKEALKRSEIKSKNVVIGLFGKNTVVRKIQLAGGAEEEIEDQVLWEAEQYIPFNLDEAEVSYDVAGETDTGGVETIIAAATHGVIKHNRDVVEKAGLNVKVIDLGVLALTNIFDFVHKDEVLKKPDNSFLLIEFGAQKSTVVIYRGGRFVFSKDFFVGGVMITEEIQRHMGVNYQAAEDLKTSEQRGVAVPEEVLKIIKDMSQTLFLELRKTLDFYITASQDDTIEDCYITGGTARLPGLVEGLETLLGVKVNIFNPFDKIDFDKKRFTDEEIAEISTRGVVAIGLAMRSLND